MQYPYLTFLEAITLVLTLFIGIIIIYFLIRLFNKTVKFLTVLKVILLYELCAIIVYSIYPEPIFSSLKFSVLKLVILGIILFLIFYFITRKTFQIKWWKSLVVFLLMVLIIFPFLDFFRTNLEMKLMNFSVFAEENIRFENQINQIIKERGFMGAMFSVEQYIPLSLKILGKIEGGVFSWAGSALRQIIWQKNNEPVEKIPEYYVKVISPNRGEKVEAGHPLDIKWDSKNIGTVNVSLLSSDDLSFDNVYVSRVCSKVDASLGYCQGTLKDFHTAPYYKIRIEGYREKPSEDLSYTVITDESDNYFNILIEQ